MGPAARMRAGRAEGWAWPRAGHPTWRTVVSCICLLPFCQPLSFDHFLIPGGQLDGDFVQSYSVTVRKCPQPGEGWDDDDPLPCPGCIPVLSHPSTMPACTCMPPWRQSQGQTLPCFSCILIGSQKEALCKQYSLFSHNPVERKWQVGLRPWWSLQVGLGKLTWR